MSRQVMARLGVPSIISQWLHHLETDSLLMDKFETTYRSQYEAAGSCEEERAECCVPCQCVEACSERAGQVSVLHPRNQYQACQLGHTRHHLTISHYK